MLNPVFRTWIIIASATGAAGLLLLLVACRLSVLLRVRGKAVARQLPEIINCRTLINRYQQPLPLLRQFNPQSGTLYVLVADYFGAAQYSFAHWWQQHPARGTVALLALRCSWQQPSEIINNHVDLLRALHRQFPAVRLRLLLEGYSCGLGWLIGKQLWWLTDIIYLNPITNPHAMRLSVPTKLLVAFAACCTWRVKVRLRIDYQRLVADRTAVTALTTRHRQTPALMLIWLKQTNYRFLRHCSQIKRQQTIVQATADPFYQPTRFHRYLQFSRQPSTTIWVKTRYHFNLAVDLPCT